MPTLGCGGIEEGSPELPDPDLENGAEFVNAVKHKIFLIIKLVWGRDMAAPSEVLQSVTFFTIFFEFWCAVISSILIICLVKK